MFKKLYFVQEKQSNTNKVVSTIPPCPDNLTLNDICNNEGVSVKNDAIYKRHFTFTTLLWYVVLYDI